MQLECQKFYFLSIRPTLYGSVWMVVWTRPPPPHQQHLCGSYDVKFNEELSRTISSEENRFSQDAQLFKRRGFIGIAEDFQYLYESQSEGVCEKNNSGWNVVRLAFFSRSNFLWTDSMIASANGLPAQLSHTIVSQKLRSLSYTHTHTPFSTSDIAESWTICRIYNMCYAHANRNDLLCGAIN